MPEESAGTQCAAIVLAAGASSRLGQSKQLLQLDGESLLHRTVRFASEVRCAPIIVVLGFEVGRLRQELDGFDLKIAINPDWQSGMGSSVRCGINALLEEHSLTAKVLFLVCDQVKLSQEILGALIAQSAKVDSLLTVSSYAGRLGVPAIFKRQLYPELLCTEGDEGARSLIQRYRNQATVVDFPEGAADIDTIEDLKFIQRT